MSEIVVVDKLNGIMNGLDNQMFKYHSWRHNSNLVTKLMLVFIFAELTAIGALARVYTPYTPVPFTLQTFFVLLSGVMLGRYWGGASQVVYLVVGLIGVPWFAGATGGVDVIFGATGGYLVGFVLASLLVGELTERRMKRDWMTLFSTMMVGSLVILVCGTVGLMAVMDIPLKTALMFGFWPFVAVELIKSIVAGGTANFLTTKKNYGPEA